ncbi:mitochondrial aldehyde dehydrogenase [Pseudogymnoascus australis]
MITSIDPATKKSIAEVHMASEADVDRAVKAAKVALKTPEWKLMPGKPYMEALTGDLPEAISTIRYYGGWTDKTFGQTISTTHQKFAYPIRQPIGVVG